MLQFKHSHESRLRYFYIAHLAHTFLTFLLFFQQFTLTRNITTVTLRSYVFTYSTNVFAGNYLRSDSSLYGNLKLLAGDKLFKLLADFPSKFSCPVLVYKCGKCINHFTVYKNIKPYQF